MSICSSDVNRHLYFLVLDSLLDLYLSWRMNSTSCPEWHVLIQLTQIALRSVVLHVWHLENVHKKI